MVRCKYSKIKEMHGDYGVAAVDWGLRVRYCNVRTRIAVVRVQHGAHRFVTSVIPFIEGIENELASFSTLYIGASLRHCYMFIQDYQKQKLKEIWNLLSTNEEKQRLKSAFLHVKFLWKNENKSEHLPYSATH